MLDTLLIRYWSFPIFFCRWWKSVLWSKHLQHQARNMLMDVWLPAPKHFKDASDVLAYCSLKYCFHPQETLMMQHHWVPRCSPPPLLKYHPRSKRRHPHRLPLPPSTPASVLTGIMWCRWKAMRWYDRFCKTKIKRFCCWLALWYYSTFHHICLSDCLQ